MDTPDRLDKRGLLSQIENFKLIFQMNSEELEKNPPLREDIRQRMAELESCVKELDILERSHDAITFNQILDQANHLLLVMKGLMRQLFAQDTFPFDDDLQSPDGPEASL
jgi:hypothetical protein